MNMKKTKPKKLLTVLLTLYLALSIVPITAYAGVTDVIGDNTTNPYSHFYHTKVETTAQVTIKDADGNVIETTEVTKSGNFVEGNVNSDAVQAEIKRIDDEIIAQFSSRGNITTENRNSTFMFDHFESGNIIAPDGDILVGDQDALENAASGSVNRNIVVHEYQVYQTTYDLIVQAIDGGSQDKATINNVCIENVKFAYRSGDAPQATAEVYNTDDDKYEIAYECWEKMENGEPVAFWYYDESKYTPSMKKITQFEEGKTYMYSIELREKNGYTFADNCSVTINGNPISATANAVKTVDGLFIMNVETICPEATKEISVIEINNATLTFKDGDKPVFTGTVPENDQYAFRCEWWSLDENTGIVSTEPEWGGDIYKNKITAFEAGKTYHYGVYVTAYTADISPDAKLKINGREVKYTRIGDESDTQSFWVETDLTMTPDADGHTHKYGTEWKYDETNHWHECECGNKADITAHTFKQIIDKKATATEKGSKHEECTVCGYKKAAVDIPKIDSHNHNYGTEWKYDETNHWHECECGNKADITAHTFKQIIDKEATATEKGSKHEECTVCGYKKAAVDIPVTDFRNSSDDQPNKPINTASSESSSADQTNKPINTASPKTGNTDNMILWIVLLIAGGGAFITATAVDRKKK
jgi:Zn ribbon nucleic-acid-binding protein